MSGASAPQPEPDTSARTTLWQRLVRHQHALAAGAGLLLFSVALWVLHHELGGGFLMECFWNQTDLPM